MRKLDVRRERKADRVQLLLLRQALIEALEQCWEGQMPFRVLERALAKPPRVPTKGHKKHTPSVAWR